MESKTDSLIPATSENGCPEARADGLPGADSSVRCPEVNGLAALAEGIKEDMMLSKRCLDTYLRKGFLTQQHYARGQIDAFQSVLNRINAAQSDAPQRSGELETCAMRPNDKVSA